MIKVISNLDLLQVLLLLLVGLLLVDRILQVEDIPEAGILVGVEAGILVVVEAGTLAGHQVACILDVAGTPFDQEGADSPQASGNLAALGYLYNKQNIIR